MKEKKKATTKPKPRGEQEEGRGSEHCRALLLAEAEISRGGIYLQAEQTQLDGPPANFGFWLHKCTAGHTPSLAFAPVLCFPGEAAKEQSLHFEC